MNQSLISVIVPVYNVEKYIEKCITSIMNQTYKNIEIILIDDGSTDNSGIICDYYKKMDNRIIVFHTTNQGLSNARNKGLKIANGEFISFIDSDDYIEENMIENLYNNIIMYNSDISVCDYYQVKNNKKRVYSDFLNNTCFSISKEIMIKNITTKYYRLMVPAWNKMYRKKVFDDINYPCGKIFEDSYILYDIIDKVDNISFIIKPLYNYVFRDNSIVNSFSISHFDSIDSFNKNIEFLNKKGYYDLALEEKNRKMDSLIVNISKMKRYKIKNKEVYKKYYKELVDTNKEVKWKNATWKNKLFKVLRRPSISILAFGLRVRDLIRR